MMNRKKIELYVHIPFCEKKCNYCDFLSQTANDVTMKAYVNKLIEEIQVQSANYSEYQVTSIFIGGGTPSILRPESIANIMAMIEQCFVVESGAEVTLEINPATVTPYKLEVYKHAEINRISIGLQSANDEELKLLGRIHTYDDFLKTYQRVREAGFTNVNIDIMSAIPGQTLPVWKNTVKKVSMLKPEHISAYGLILEEGTLFYEKYTKEPDSALIPDEDTDRIMYYATGEILSEQGYNHYEISNYAKPGFECRHNKGYWTGVEYLGFGLGASSYVMDHRFHNERNLKKYMDINLNRDITPLYQDIQKINEKEKIEEFMFLGLRLMEGVSGSEFLTRFGKNMWSIYGNVLETLEHQKLIKVEKPYVHLTEKGIDISNYVMSQFLLS